MSPDNTPTNKSGIKWFIGISFLSLICCFGVPGWISYLMIPRLDGPSLSTDQVLASLGIMVTVLGLFIALAAVGIAVFAVLGFSELRSMVDRRTDAGLQRIEEVLREKGLTDNHDVDRARLAKKIAPILGSESVSTGIPQPGMQKNGNLSDEENILTSAEQPIAREYPKGKGGEE